MAVGYKNSSGVDFDSLFEPFTSAAPGAQGIGNYYDSTGTLIYNRYEAAASGTAASNVKYFNSFGGDIGPQWAAIGSVSTAPTWDMNANHNVFIGRITSGGCYGGIQYNTNGTVFKYTTNTSSSKPGGSNIDGITTPTGDTNASDYQFRVGDRTGSDPSRLGVAVTIPTGAIASQTWHNFSGQFEYYFSTTGTNQDTCGFNLQFRHVPSGDTSSVKAISMQVGYIN